MKTKMAWGLGVLVLLLAVFQVIPVDRGNPPVESAVPASPEVRAVLQRACYDCHSNETVWPWYSRIAPISWLIAHDVHEGRRELNLSTWNRMSAERRGKTVRKIRKEVDEGGMPPWYYVPVHPHARLSPQEKILLREGLR